METNKEVIEVTTLALSVPDQARKIMITSHEAYARAGELLLTIKAIRKKITETFKPIKQKMDAAKQEVLDQERKADAPLKEAEALLSPQIIKWNTEQEKIRKAEEDRLQEIARKEEEDRQIAAAIHAEETGNKEEAAAIMDAPVYVPPVVVKKEVPKVAGISIVERWKFRIVNERLIPREYLKVDEVLIGQVVRNSHGVIKIPGIEAYNEGSVTGRTK